MSHGNDDGWGKVRIGSYNSKLVSEVSDYANRYGRYNCMRRYNSNIVDIGSTCFTNAKRITQLL
jgi:hypothetical protein